MVSGEPLPRPAGRAARHRRAQSGPCLRLRPPGAGNGAAAELSVKLGILDWGIGGVGFYALTRARLPELPVVYWSDAGAVPYGKQAPADLARRLVTIGRWLKREAGVTHLAIACNAASSVLPRIDLADEMLPEMTGVIAHGARAALER